MSQFNHKIRTTLDESRMLVLGAQILVGFEFRSVFESGYQKMPDYGRYLKLGGLGLLLVTLALLFWPAAYHQIVERGEDTYGVKQFATRVMAVALLPYAVALGLDFFTGAETLLGRSPALIAGLGATAVSLFFWYGIEVIRRAQRPAKIRERIQMSKQREKGHEGKTQLKDKIEHVLTECRVVLPGAQALLGFQFVALLMEEFEKLPSSLKVVHFISLCLVAFAVILLMTPAAYHRLVEEGEDTSHFHQFASRTLLASMVSLALGVTGDFYLVAWKVTESNLLSLVLGALSLCCFYGLWFGFTFYRRRKREQHNQPQLQVRVSSVLKQSTRI